MPKKKVVDGKKLIQAVKSEIPQPEIMEAFGFKTSTQLKTAYMNALIEQGEVPAIVSGRGTAKATTSNEVNVGKRGSIIIPKGLVEELGCVENDKIPGQENKIRYFFEETLLIDSADKILHLLKAYMHISKLCAYMPENCCLINYVVRGCDE